MPNILVPAVMFSHELQERKKHTLLGARYFYRMYMLISCYNHIAHAEELDILALKRRAAILRRFFTDRSLSMTDRMDRQMSKDALLLNGFLEEFREEAENQGKDTLQEYDMRDHPLAFLVGIPEE